MTENNQAELESLKQQLEQVKRQDQILEEIEANLIQMKLIAQYAVDYNLSDKALARLNKKIQEREKRIEVLENKLVKIK